MLDTSDKIVYGEYGEWLETTHTQGTLTRKDGSNQEISIVTAMCSRCENWSEEINNFPPYMHYKFCPCCGVPMK